MVLSSFLYKAIAYTVNVVIIGFILYTVFDIKSDKSPVIFMVFYPALIILNIIISIVLSVLKVRQAGIYRQIAVIEIAMFIPIIFIISQF